MTNVHQNVHLYRHHARWLENILREGFPNLDILRGLDVGCGVGVVDRYLSQALGDLHGLENRVGLLTHAVRIAPYVRFRGFTGRKIPYPNDSFDVAFSVCGMRRTPPEDREELLQDMVRVVAPGGWIVLLEPNPLRLALGMRGRETCPLSDTASPVQKHQVKRILTEAGVKILGERYGSFSRFRATNEPMKQNTSLSRLPFGHMHCLWGEREED